MIKRTLRRSFPWQLMRNFLLSTLIPFLAVTSLIARFYSVEYSRDVRLLLDTAASSVNGSLTTYLDELEQATLQPYYNDSLYSYLRKKSKGVPFDILTELPLRKNLDSCFQFIRFSRADISGIFIVSDDRCLYSTTNSEEQELPDGGIRYADRDWYREAVAADGRCVLIGPHTPDYAYSSHAPVISIVRSIVTLTPRSPLYVIRIDVNASVFHRILKDVSFHVPSRICIRDGSGRMVYTNASFSEDDREALRAASGQTVRLSDGSWRLYSYPMENYPWTLTVLLSDGDLRSRSNIIYLTALLVYLIGLVTAACSYLLVSKRMAASIRSMKEVCAAIQKNDFERKYDYDSGTELDSLGEFLNQTSGKLKDTIEREYTLALKQKDSEFRALQAQIQPHFLFNTLNNFIALNQMGDRETLENSLFALSEMLRYITKAPSVIPLESELRFLEDYCALQKLRFSDRLSFEIRRCPGTAELRIPKLLIQPLVENSVLHGTEPANRPCRILIEIRREGRALTVTVEDDGVGCDMAALSPESIGLANVKKRLLSFSPQSRMTMESTPGKGTKTVLILYPEETDENTDC